MDLKIDVKGLKELEKALTLLPLRVAVKHASKAVREGAKVIQQAARAKVPVDTGNLKRSISVKVLNRNRDAYQVTAMVGPEIVGRRSSKKKKIDAFYAHWVEYGTKAHHIPKQGVNDKVMTDGQGKFFGRSVDHPGIPFQPFMRPAFDENIAAAQKIIQDVLTVGVADEASKLYGGR
jgi:HK97 gp10 family phage protein